MLDVVALLIFFAMLGAMFLGDKRLAYVWVFLSIIVFPQCIFFTQSPQVSPQQVFLYGFFAVSLVWNRDALMEGLLKHPLRIPLLMLFISLFLTAILNGEGAKGGYNAFRYYMENYAYLIIAFVGGLNYRKIRLEDKWLYPVALLVVLGIVEYFMQRNFIFPIICRAFPFYDGYYDLDGVVSAARMYRNRIFLTTTHPTALGCMLCSALMFFTCRLKLVRLPRNKAWLIWGGLCLLVCLSGSRTAVACALIGLILYVFMKLGVRGKFIVLVFVGFTLAGIMPKVVDTFSVEGEGSSMTLRQEQLLFSYIQFMKSPIYGNGVRYISKFVMERDTYNDRITNDEIGGLESVVFFQLIDYGLIGFVSYFLLFIIAFIYFFRRRQNSYAQAGLLVTICFAIFACLSGEIGGNNSFAYMIMGYCMGALHVEEKSEGKPEGDDGEGEKDPEGENGVPEDNA